ncbi:MAG: HlyC/CorC family transporter [Verrucomicrobia subdivision 3 bacterium]|nr:HlyC/CorC family transporter [Limisphaerales bacterium]
MQWYTELALLLLFTGIGFFFALAETALLTLGKWRLRQITAHQPESGVFIRKLLAAPHDLLATMTLVTTLAHAAIIATALAISWKLDKQHFVFVALLLAAGLLLFCEVVPKTLAMRRPQSWAPRVARPLLWLVWFTQPVRFVAQWINRQLLRLVPNSIKPMPELSDEEYSELIELGWQSGTLGISEKEIILNIMRLDRRPVSDLMRPRSQMACIPHNLELPELIASARENQHRRLPMYDESPDTIVGVLNAPRLLADPTVDMVEVIDFPSFVPEEMNLLELLKSFQRYQHNMAIVLDEFGGTVGLVTLEDILNDVVGGLRREGGADEFVMEEIAPGNWRLSGSVWLEDFRREYPQLQRAKGVDTIGGLVASQMDVIPPVGTEVEYSGLKLKITEADGRRVLEVEAQRIGGGR